MSKLNLSEKLLADIDMIVGRYPRQEAALIPVLHRLQEEIGWLPVEAMDFAAERLGLPRPRVYGVASFYSMFRRQPTGRHRLEICTNISCSLMGAEHLREHLKRRLGIEPGQTTPDGLITLTEVECLGSCGTAPVMLVDDEYHENLTPEKVDLILEKLRSGRKEDSGV